ncbi:MAG: hypothetical protein NT030_08195, partial [Candidatus Saganbacteria bacterium]|nr:hypothetical protein [Candidatus Saganbacteria bacterium]
MSSSYNILALSSVSALPPKGKGERPEPAVSPGVKIEAGKNDYDHKKFVEAKLQELGVNISGTSIGFPEIDEVYSAMAEINVKGELADKVLKLILQNISSHGFLYEIKHPQSPEEYSALLTYAMMLRKMGLELSFDPGAPLTGEALNKLISDMKTVVKMFKIDKGIGSPDDGLFTGDVQAAIIKEFKISYLDVVQKITGELSDDLFYITLGSKEKPGYIGRVTAKDQLNETIFNPRDDLLFTTLTVISSLPDVKIGKGGVYDSGTVKELFRKYLEVVYIGENDKNFRGLISKYSSPRQDAGDLSRLYKYFNEKIKGMPLEVDELGSKEPVETYVESIFNGKGTDEALKRIDSFLEALAKIHDSIYSSEISQGKKALKEREDIKEILKLSVGKAKYTKLLKMLMQVYSQEIADRLSKSFVVDDLKREFGPFIKLYAEISGDESIGKRYEEIEGKQGKEYVAEVEKLLNEIGNGYQQKLGQKKYDEIHEMAKRLIEKQVLIDNSSTDIGRYRIFLGLLENDKLKYEPLSDKYYGKIGVAKRTPIVLNIEPGIPVDVYVVDIEHSQDDPVFKEIAELFVDGKYVNRDDVKKEGASSIVFNVMNNPSFGGNLTGQALAVIYRETENRDIQIAEMIENGKQLDLRADAFSGYVAESGVEASVKRYVAMREALDLVGLKDMSVSEAYEKLEEAYSDGKIRILTYIDDKSSTPVTKAGFLSLDPIDPDNGGKVLHGHDDPLDVKILRGLLMYKYGARSLEWDVLKDNKIASTFVNSFSAFQNDQGMFNTDSLALDIVFEILDKYSGINKDVLTLACKYSLDTIQEILNSMSQTSSFKLTDDFKKEIIESTKMRIREAENSAGLSDIGKLIKGNLSEIEGIISIVVDQIIISLQLNSGEKLDRQFIVETIGPIIQDAVNKIIPYSNAIKKSGDLEKDNLAITHDLVNNLISKCAESTVREGNRIEGKYTQIDLPVDSTTTQPADLVGKKEKTSIEITSDTDMHELAWENRNFVLKLYLKEFGSRPISKVDGKYYAETDIMAEDLDAFIKFKAGKIEKGKTRANPVEIALIQKVKGYVNSGKVVITDIFKNIPGNSDVASETNEVLKILRDFYEDVLRRIVISNSDKE